MNITTLGSGSSGNGYVIQNDHEALIIECGINYKYAVEALHGNVGKVNGCLVTMQDFLFSMQRLSMSTLHEEHSKKRVLSLIHSITAQFRCFVSLWSAILL